LAGAVEGGGVVEGCGAEEADGEEEGGPDVPEAPLGAEAAGLEGGEIAERDEGEGQQPREEAMEARADAAENVAAVELAGGQEI